jgi:large subunit ribosomal protein L6
MSRIGAKAVAVPSGVTVQQEGARLAAKGPKGEMSVTVPAPVEARVQDGKILVSIPGEAPEARGLHGLTRTLIANMLSGVASGFSKELELQGVGFRAAVQGDKLTMALGYSHPVEFLAPAGIKIAVKESTITVSGPNKQLVGNVAARIRSFFPPEPYKGKGVRYKGEYVRRKAGKTVA